MARAGSIVKIAQVGDEKATANGVVNKTGTEVETAFIPITTLESISLGFRQSMFTLLDKDGNGGEVLSTGGLGGSTLILEWTDGDVHKQVCVDCVDLLVRWVETFDPKSAQRLREAVA